MKTRFGVCTLAVLVCVGSGALGDEPPAAPAPVANGTGGTTITEKAGSDRPAESAAEHQADPAEQSARPARVEPGKPYVRVRAGAAASVHPVGRVQVEDRTIVKPAGATSVASTRRSDGLIEVPLNTLGPGESLQQRNERIGADNRRRLAEARIAEREAARPAPREDERDSIIVFGPHGGVHGHHLRREYRRRLGPIGPVRTEIIGFENEIHGGALKHFADASSAGTGVLGGLHQDAIRFGVRAATPPLIEQQRDRDAAQRNLRRAP